MKQNINFSNSKVEGSAISIGENSLAVVNNLPKEIDWEKLNDDIIDAISALPKDSKENEAAKKLQKEIVTQNENGIIKTIKQYAPMFMSELFSAISSQFLMEFIRSFI